ncbi:MAG: protein kinase, partial [Candidatus Eiseniibacteriota bacterium]
MPIQVGQKLLHYRLLEQIGRGGMGVVWKAEDTKLQRRVALKLLPESMAADRERRARFEREARAVAALNHPNIVTLHAVEEASTPDGPVHFIAMELVEGQTLKQLLPAGGFPLPRLLEIAVPLVDAVSAAHRAGITHRDLKPDNVMIDAEGRLRVLDFGLAKLHEPVTATGAQTETETVTSDTSEGRLVGTVAYMSPEQAEGKPADARSDIFSLGTMLYEMATGERPFRGETSMSTIGSILKEEPSSITDLKPALPRHAGRIVRRCLAKEPERRYQTALDLRNELEELQAETPGAAATESRGSRGPLLVGGVAVLAVAVVATVVWLRVLPSSREESPSTLDFKSVPITASSARDMNPAWSPDGKFVAFESMRDGNLDIFVKAVDGDEAVARVQEPGEQSVPRWTPDGRYLAYHSKQEPGTPIFLVPVDGGEPQRLVETGIHTLAHDRRVMGDRPWSNDGTKLLVTRATAAGRLAVFRVDRATGSATQLTFPPPGGTDSGATHSFDGERVLFTRQVHGSSSLMVMPAAGGEPEELLGPEYRHHAAAWRPDDRRVVYNAGPATNRDLYELDTVSGAIRRLTNLNQSVNSFSVSVDDRIAYVPFRHDTFLHVVDVATREDRQITSHSDANFRARFSPDDRTVVYTSNRTGTFQVWLHPMDGSPERRFTPGVEGGGFAAWSPDGNRLVFLSQAGPDASQRIFVAAADGATRARMLVDQELNWGQGTTVVRSNPLLQWSQDGELIAYRVVGEQGPE